MSILFVLACATDQGPEPSVLDTGFFEYDELEDYDYDLDWDDPLFRPDVDRNAPKGYPISIPLGTNNARDIVDGEWKGEGTDSKLGIAVRYAGDVDGDGTGDMVIGSLNDPTGSSDDGAAYLDLGGDFHTGNSRIDLGSNAEARFYGDSTGAKSGEQVAGNGDFDGDGNDDWAIGARNWDDPVDTWKVNAGAAYLITGGTTGNVTLPTSSILVSGDKANENFGAGVDYIDDINGDGNWDLIIGGTGMDTNGTNSGAISVFYGPLTADSDNSAADATIGGETAGDQVGNRLVGIGDYDGDGNGDFAVGARREDTNGTDAGAVYIVTSGTMPSTLADADVILRGNKAGWEVGNSLKEVGDVDADGKSDLFVGGLGHGGKGGAYVILSGTTSGNIGAKAQSKMYGQLAADQFGADVAMGDADGDGTADALVTANRQGVDDRGALYVFYGPHTGSIAATSADSKLVGVTKGDKFGSAVDFITDAYASGDDAVVVGASSAKSTNQGGVYIFQVP
ncbi:MAG: hypothetical protein GY913_33500 [Proteobacteria bacterium]|nr:hypothetical protein [Pseudomonadota bacterium]MCP4921843.1 hypothetical protein [Pseudomonadota bacterium]